MGNLLRFPPGDRFCRRFPHFIETGCGDQCLSLALMACYPFETLTTIEISPFTADRARKRFGDDPRVLVVQGSSHAMLPKVIASAGLRPTFFWLDAHHPSNWEDDRRYRVSEQDYDVGLPLEAELRAIRELRPDGDYFIAIDDLRLYDDRDWGDKISQPEGPKKGLSFLDPFRATHDVKILTDDSGYALIGPHEAPWLEFRG